MSRTLIKSIEFISFTVTSAALLVACQPPARQSVTLHSPDARIDGLVVTLPVARPEEVARQGVCSEAVETTTLKNVRVCQTKLVTSVSADLKAAADGQPSAVRSVIFNSSVGRGADLSVEALASPTTSEMVTVKVSQMRYRAAHQSFESREEFQQLQIAKANMRLHYLNLLPHLTMNSIVAVTTATDGIALLTSIGDLLPFLLPSRWLGSAASKHLERAEVWSYQIVREDAMNLAEGLALSVARDEELVAKLKTQREPIVAVIAQIKALEAQQKLATGRWRDVASPLNLLDEAISGLDAAVEAEKYELAAAVGMKPGAIRSVVADPDIDIQKAASTPSDASKMVDGLSSEEARVQRALDSAAELEQLAELIQGAKREKHGRKYEWLDPSGDPQSGWGVALPQYVKISRGNVRELQIEIEQQKNTLTKKVVEAGADSRIALKNFALALAGIEIQTGRIETAIAEITATPNDTPVGELQDALTQLPYQVTQLYGSEYAWYQAASRLRRLTHTGPYMTGSTGAVSQKP